MRVLLTNTRVPKNTGALVAGVGARLKKYPGVVDPILTSIDAISRTCLDVIRRTTAAATDPLASAGGAAEGGAAVGAGGDAGAGAATTDEPAGGPLTLGQAFESMAELIDMNQQLLNALGVGHAALDTVVRESAARGFHCKLTGAGTCGASKVYAAGRAGACMCHARVVMSPLHVPKP